jgi:hypothetical protein
MSESGLGEVGPEDSTRSKQYMAERVEELQDTGTYTVDKRLKADRPSSRSAEAWADSAIEDRVAEVLRSA